jgi:glutamate 5-kinase
MEDLCSGKGKLGTGGMRTKLRAAKVASEAGVHVAIVNGRHPHAIKLAIERKIGTYFRRNEKRGGTARPNRVT